MAFSEQQKRTLGLICPDGRFSNLALILSDQCPYTTKAAIFEGTNKEKFKDRKEFSGSLFKQIDDRLEFMSLGGIMPGVTYDLLLMGVSVARNEKLAQVFYRLKIIEAFGTGIPRIFAAYEKSVVKPEIPFVDGGFLIRLPNQNHGLQKARATKSEREQRLLDFFKNVGFTKEDAAKILGMSVSGAYKLLVRMSIKGLLNSKKDGKRWVYSAVK
ncbi:MAG: hypothetical protein KAH01_07270 [Caldisericia bacterium]|nr:hypothetical protein [Caldisericia bacterium]